MTSLAERLIAHAELHDAVCHGDPEQVQWAKDLRECAAIVRAYEGGTTARVPKAKVGDMLLMPMSHDFAGTRVRIVPIDGGRDGD